MLPYMIPFMFLRSNINHSHCLQASHGFISLLQPYMFPFILMFLRSNIDHSDCLQALHGLLLPYRFPFILMFLR